MLKVYNTLTGVKEEFKPTQPGKVSIYCCGVTPYNHPHIGNARPFVIWDVIRRYLGRQGYEVRYVQNFTDVDDKIIAAAKRENVSWREISDRYIESYFEVMDKLNIRRADVYPRVSENIPEIIAMIEKLIAGGYAYSLANGDVFFAVQKFSGYGKLSGRDLEEMQAGARVEVDSRKHHPMDFALWKAAKPGEPYWESPWGKGRPGWHIECSVMSLKYLGETFDFHGGGSDLIFPHHENEIAQSQGAIGSDTSFARYWLHNGFITVRNEKMSKSADNFFLVKDILAKYSGETVRFFILQTHYRSPLDFADERLAEAQTSLARLRHTMECVRELKKLNGASDTAANLAARSKELMHEFEAAMNDDFNTALAIGYMFSLSKEINIYYHAVTAEGLSFDGKNFATAAENYRLMAALLGIFEQREAVEQKGDDLTDKLMGIIIDLRQSARAAKDFATADKIRDALKEIGIVIEDGKSGARWKRA